MEKFLPLVQNALQTCDWLTSSSTLITISIVVEPVLLMALYICRVSFSPSLPGDFEVYINTSFPTAKDQPILKLSEAEAEFLTQHTGQYSAAQMSFMVATYKAFSARVLNLIERKCRPVLIIDSVPNAVGVNISLTRSGQDKRFNFTTDAQKNPGPLFPDIDSITFMSGEGSNAQHHFIKGVRILQVVVDASFKGHVDFYDCWIASLKIEGRSATNWLEISLSRCYVGNLQLFSSSCSQFQVFGGGIRELVCPGISETSPVDRVIQIDGSATLHSKPERYGENQIANYRNLSFHAVNRANSLTKQVIGAAIFRLERKGDSGFLKFVNTCYRLFSRYNTRSGLPLVWMIFSFAYCWYLAFVFDLGVVTNSCATSLAQQSSWVSELCGSDVAARGVRSFALIFNSVVNPFATLSSAAPLKPKTVAFATFLSIVGVLNLLWITLMIFSVKIRFTNKTTGPSS